MNRTFHRIRIIAAIVTGLWAALFATAPANAQTGPTLLQEKSDGPLTLSLWSASGSDVVGVNNTYTWIATNTSPSSTLTGVILGSHWEYL